MEVILLQDVKSLGKKGDKVKVNDGYARNFIIPKKLGVEATAANVNDLKLQKANEARLEKKKLEDAQALAEKLEKATIKTIEDGVMTGDLYSMSKLENKTKVDTEGFLRAVDERLKVML